MKEADRTIGFIIFLFGSLGFISCAAGANSSRTFTVQDSIELPRIETINSTDSDVSISSPDGAFAAIVVRHGDVGRNENIDRIVVFNTTKVREWLARKTGEGSPPAEVVDSVTSSTSGGGVSNLTWVSPRSLAFVAADRSGINQVYVVDIRAKTHKQFSASKTNVVSFALKNGTLVYYARVSKRSRPPALVITGMSLGEVFDRDIGDDDSDLPVQLFVQHEGDLAPRLVGNPVTLISNFMRIWISPSARYAVTFVPSTNWPHYWSEYRTPFFAQNGFIDARRQRDPTSDQLIQRPRYALIDLETGAEAPLLDGPVALLSMNGTPQEVYWTADEHYVVASNVYLPLSGATGVERERRSTTPATVAVAVDSGRVQPLIWEPAITSDSRIFRSARISRIDWDTGKQVLAVTTRKPDGSVTITVRRYDGRTWHEISGRKTESDSTVSYSIHERLEERPKLFASDADCGCSRQLFDPAPQADQFRFAHAEIFQWIDRYKEKRSAGLVYPANFVKGQTYPLVVQTHGFNPAEFLLDGPHDPHTGGTTAYAAQALANAGMFVLQLPDDLGDPLLSGNQGSSEAQSYHDAIEALLRSKPIDRSRVGLIAFSHTGLGAYYLLSKFPELIRVVQISDATTPGYLEQLLVLNSPSEAQFLAMSGGLILKGGYGKWFESQPLYNLANSHVAVRLEANTYSSVIGAWEAYAILERAGNPVDFIEYPHGSHALEMPQERLQSQGGAVDWFRFWLQEYIDPAPEKTEQYNRWRTLAISRERRPASH